MPNRKGGLRDKADMLYRAASECHRQHTRYSRLVDKGALDDEQRAALEMAYMCDDYLASAITGYESAKGHGDGHADDAWWHKGNMLMHASKEYIRRHSSCDGLAKKFERQGPNRLAVLTMSFDLEASALLALRMATDAYRAARPEAE